MGLSARSLKVERNITYIGIIGQRFGLCGRRDGIGGHINVAPALDWAGGGNGRGSLLRSKGSSVLQLFGTSGSRPGLSRRRFGRSLLQKLMSQTIQNINKPTYRRTQIETRQATLEIGDRVRR